ncbi:hypothetical protein AgCh_010119 [Apium graveolens]
MARFDVSSMEQSIKNLKQSFLALHEVVQNHITSNNDTRVKLDQLHQARYEPSSILIEGIKESLQATFGASVSSSSQPPTSTSTNMQIQALQAQVSSIQSPNDFLINKVSQLKALLRHEIPTPLIFPATKTKGEIKARLLKSSVQTQRAKAKETENQVDVEMERLLKAVEVPSLKKEFDELLRALKASLSNNFFFYKKALDKTINFIRVIMVVTKDGFQERRIIVNINDYGMDSFQSIAFGAVCGNHVTTTMARTRSGSSSPEGTLAGKTQMILSAMEIPQHSTYAATQGGAQTSKPPLPPRGINLPPIIDLDGPLQRRTVVSRADPSNLLPLGDPDDPTPPFIEEIMNAHISRKFKMPTIKAYDGTGDPANHVRTFSNILLLQPVNDAIKCQTFPQTLSGWLKDGIVGAKESLRDYLNRFTKEAVKVPDLDDKVAMIALQQGTRDEFFKMSLAKRPPIDKYPRTEQNIDSASKKGGLGQKFTEYAKLNAPRSQILMEIEKDRDICWPKPLKVDPTKLDKSKYCRFHKDTSHDTDECRQLKDEIEFLIRKGRLSKYTGDGGDRNNNGRKNFDDRRRDQDDQGRSPQPRGPVINAIFGGPLPRGSVINTIFGGPTAASSSKNSRKAYNREVMHIVGDSPKRARTGVKMAFDDSDLEGVKFPHDDPLVITLIIGNSPVKRVLVDNGASVDILLHDTFLRMGYNDSQLTPTDMPIYMFVGVMCHMERIIG